MHKLFAITFVAIALSACSSMSNTRSMGSTAGNPAETQNSSDANRSRNPSSVSPGGGSPGGSSGSGAGGAR